MDHNECMDFIHSFHKKGVKKRSLDKTRELLREIGSPEERLRFIHVVGTNGKGSVCAMLESALRASGYKTGLFTSPYIRRFNERIRIDGEDVSDETLDDALSRLMPLVKGLEMTEFELVTVLGLMIFAESGCEIVVLEAGLGGGGDFTNVIPAPLGCVFTAIGLDHTAILGDTVAEIAREKAGVIKPGACVISLGNDESAEAEIRAKAESLGCDYRRVPIGNISIEDESMDSVTFSFGRFTSLRLPLGGSYQPMNAATAITALDALKLDRVNDEAIRTGLESVAWAGRFEILSENPFLILDGAHNPQACRATVRSLMRKLGGKKPVFVIGIMSDKDVDGVIRELLAASEEFYCVPVDYPRAMTPEELCGRVSALGGKAIAADSIAEGIGAAVKAAGRDGAVCCLGTLYFQNEVRDAVKNLG